jgi:hypothetical protein
VGTFQDVTRQVIFGRRLSMLLEINTCSANVRETKLFWQRLLEALGSNHNDVPFAILYSVEEIWENDIRAFGATQIRPRKICTLEGSLGFRQDMLPPLESYILRKVLRDTALHSGRQWKQKTMCFSDDKTVAFPNPMSRTLSVEVSETRTTPLWCVQSALREERTLLAF